MKNIKMRKMLTVGVNFSCMLPINPFCSTAVVLTIIGFSIISVFAQAPEAWSHEYPPGQPLWLQFSIIGAHCPEYCHLLFMHELVTP